MTLTELCGYLKNWFEQKKYIGDVTITDGIVSFTGASELLDGQYIRIVGSVFNDGVYQYHAGQAFENLTNETFDGAVWAMAVPKEILAVLDDINAWEQKYGTSMSSPFTSESLSASSYSYSKASPDALKQNTAITAFSSKLSKWRKLV